jgi:hypothetical protein
METVSIIWWILAAVCNAVMDTLSHHYPTSIFVNKDPKFWNPKISWKNKYKEGVKAMGPAFYLSTGILVAFTDAWHLFKSIQIVLIVVSIITFPYSYQFCFLDVVWLNQLAWLLLYGIAWNVPFSFMYNRVLKK